MAEELDHFTFDDFTLKHLREWYAAGHAPNDWYLSDLVMFEEWLERHHAEFPYSASWPEIARAFDEQRRDDV